MLTKEFNGYTFYEDGRIVGKNGSLIQKRINKERYEIKLSINGNKQNFLFARLYYYLFVDGFDMSNKDLCISPKDGNHLNVSIDNLELVHRKDLIQGDKHKSRAKLSDEQINQIKSLYTGWVGVNQHNKTGMSYNDLAKQFGVTKGEIAQIITGKTRNQENYKLR